jgi:hypothetical protein
VLLILQAFRDKRSGKLPFLPRVHSVTSFPINDGVSTTTIHMPAYTVLTLRSLMNMTKSSGTPRTRRNASMTIFLAGGQSMTANICLELSNYFSVVLCMCAYRTRFIIYSYRWILANIEPKHSIKYI